VATRESAARTPAIPQPRGFRRPVAPLLDGLPLSREPGPSRPPRLAAAGTRRV